jgi:hypothetical protein
MCDAGNARQVKILAEREPRDVPRLFAEAAEAGAPQNGSVVLDAM